jgi:hypothetical protein
LPLYCLALRFGRHRFNSAAGSLDINSVRRRRFSRHAGSISVTNGNTIIAQQQSSNFIQFAFAANGDIVFLQSTIIKIQHHSKYINRTGSMKNRFAILLERF